MLSQALQVTLSCQAKHGMAHFHAKPNMPLDYDKQGRPPPWKPSTVGRTSKPNTARTKELQTWSRVPPSAYTAAARSSCNGWLPPQQPRPAGPARHPPLHVCHCQVLQAGMRAGAGVALVSGAGIQPRPAGLRVGTARAAGIGPVSQGAGPSRGRHLNSQLGRHSDQSVGLASGQSGRQHVPVSGAGI